MFKGYLITGLLILGTVNSSVAKEPQTQPSPVLPCKVGLFVKDELYFGVSKSTGGTVTNAEWQAFLDRVVTPNFQDGLTVVDGHGQYLNRSGKVVVESSKLLILVYPVSDSKERSLANIVTAYKKAFAQESVLRVTHCVQVTF